MLFKESMSLSVLGNEYLWLTSKEYKKNPKAHGKFSFIFQLVISKYHDSHFILATSSTNS